MKCLMFCKYDMDTACVEPNYSDAVILFIDTITAENEVADNMNRKSELDRLIYKRPLEYTQLVLGGDLKSYLKGTPEHRLMDYRRCVTHARGGAAQFARMAVRESEIGFD